jgi:hypothetical protein
MRDTRVQVVPLSGVTITDQVDQLVISKDDLWFWNRPLWRDYEMARNPTLVDHSWALTIDGTVVAAQLLTYHPELELFGLGDLPAPAPSLLHEEHPDERFAMDVVLPVMSEVFASVVAKSDSRVSFRTMPVHSHFNPATTLVTGWCNPPLYSALVLDQRWQDDSIGTRIIDLSVPLANLWADVRKSYRHIIRDSSITVTQERHDDTRQLCQDLHHRASGRVTRPSDSWVCQDSFVLADDALWFVAREGPTVLGFAYVLQWKDYAYYASAANLAPNVSHPIQWAIIKHLKELGVKYYEMGHQGGSVSKKASNIEFFRRGFGGQDVLQPIHGCRVNQIERVVH